MEAHMVTPEDIIVGLAGGAVDASDEQIEALIEETLELIEDEYPDRVFPQSRVDRVVKRVVRRFLRNPTGARQFQETTGPTSNSYTYGSMFNGELELTAEDRRMLLGRVVRDRRAFTIGVR